MRFRNKHIDKIIASNPDRINFKFDVNDINNLFKYKLKFLTPVEINTIKKLFRNNSKVKSIDEYISMSSHNTTFMVVLNNN